MKGRCISIILTIAILVGCGSKTADKDADLSTSSIEAVSVENVDNPLESLDTTGFKVCFDVHMTKNLIFLPNYFDSVYGVGTKYDDAITLWGKLNFTEAERKLLDVMNAIEESAYTYYPDDIAFVKQALGILYCDKAEYKKAYDFLIDAFVTMDGIYGTERYANSLELLYPLAVSLSLSHYYYDVGDYEGCLKELSGIRSTLSHVDLSGIDSGYQLFIKVMTNDIEACINQDRGQYQEAYDLYAENYNSCSEYIENSSDDTLGRIMCISCFTRMGDCYAKFLTKPEYAEKANDFYTYALKICDTFTGDLKDQHKSIIYLKHARFLSNFELAKEESIEVFKNGTDIMVRLESDRKGYPSEIEAYIMCAEYVGFIENSKDDALLYYERGLELTRLFYGENHPETANIYESMGRYYANRLLETEVAIDYFEKGIEIYKNLLLENHIKVADMLLHLGGCYKIIGEEEESDNCLERAYEIYDKLGIEILRNE